VAVDGRSDHLNELIGSEGLADELSPCPLILRSSLHTAQDKDGDPLGRVVLAQRGEHLPAIHLGHELIEKDGVWLQAHGQVEGLLAVLGVQDLEALVLENEFER
jgi:hypothetical protein